MKSLVWLALLASGLARAQVGAPVKVPSTNGPFQVTRPPDLMAGLQAMPLVAAEGGVSVAVAGRINAAQKRVDDKLKSAVLRCLPRQRTGKEWTRRIEIVMKGPRYVSVVAYDDFACGGLREHAAILPLVYDAATGGTVNWLKLLPPGAESGVDDTADGNRVGAVIWPALTQLARQQANQGCVDAFASGSEVTFVLWLDAVSGSIKAKPNSFPQAQASCALPVAITVAEARTMGGFNQDMLNALETAHRLQR